jgi:hypothetical protein
LNIEQVRLSGFENLRLKIAPLITPITNILPLTLLCFFQILIKVGDIAFNEPII